VKEDTDPTPRGPRRGGGGRLCCGTSRRGEGGGRGGESGGMRVVVDVDVHGVVVQADGGLYGAADS